MYSVYAQEYCVSYLHQLSPDRLDVIIEEVRLKVVHTQLESPQPLTDEGLGSTEC